MHDSATSLRGIGGSISDDVSGSFIAVGNGWGHRDRQGVGFLGWNGWH